MIQIHISFKDLQMNQNIKQLLVYPRDQAITWMFSEIPVVHNTGRDVVFLIFMAFIAVVASIIAAHTCLAINCQSENWHSMKYQYSLQEMYIGIKDKEEQKEYKIDENCVPNILY